MIIVAAVALLLLYYNASISTSRGCDYVLVVASNDQSSINNVGDFKSNLYRNRASYAYRYGKKQINNWLLKSWTFHLSNHAEV